MKGAKLLPTIFPRPWVHFRYRLCWGGGPERNEFSTLNQFSKLPLERGIAALNKPSVNRWPMDYETVRGLFRLIPQNMVTPSVDKRSGKPQPGEHNRYRYSYLLDLGEMCWAMEMLIIHPREFLSFRWLLSPRNGNHFYTYRLQPIRGNTPNIRYALWHSEAFPAVGKISPKWGKQNES